MVPGILTATNVAKPSQCEVGQLFGALGELRQKQIDQVQLLYVVVVDWVVSEIG